MRKKKILKISYYNGSNSSEDRGFLTSSMDRLKIFYQNIRSMRNQVLDLQIAISDHKLNMLCLLEYWLNKDEIGFLNVGIKMSHYSRNGKREVVLLFIVSENCVMYKSQK